MLNYATVSSNPFHRDNHSLSSTTSVHKKIQKAPTFSFPTEISTSSSSRVMGDYPNARKFLRPSDAVFTGSKNHCSTDESDTFSEMTLSAAYSCSNLTECDDDSKQLNGPEINSIRLASNKNTSGIRNMKTTSKGKFSGMSLQETLNSRRRQSGVDASDMHDHKDWSKWSKPSNPTKSFGPVRKRLAQVKSKIVAEKAEFRNTVKVPDFMVARARLKSTRRPGVHSCARYEEVPEKNLQLSLETKEISSKVVRSCYKLDRTQIVPNENLGFECVPIHSSSCYNGPVKERITTVQECPSTLCSSFSSSKETLSSDSPTTLNEIITCVTASNSVEKKDDFKEKLTVMFARRDQCVGSKKKPPALSSPSPLLVSSVEMSTKNLTKNRKELLSDIELKAKLQSKLAINTHGRESNLCQIDLKEEHSSIVNTGDQGSVRLASYSLSPPINPKLNNLPEKDGYQCRDDVEQDERLDSRQEVSSLTRSTPDHSKYSKMLKMGLPPGPVKNSMLRDGIDPCILFEREVEYNQQECVEDKINVEIFRRTRLHWEVIPVEKISEDCIWRIINVDPDIGKLEDSLLSCDFITF